MDDQLLRKVSKQLRWLNIWMGFLSLLLIGTIIGLAIAAYTIFMTVQEATRRVDTIQQQAEDNLNLRKQLCEGGGQISALLRQQSDACQ